MTRVAGSIAPAAPESPFMPLADAAAYLTVSASWLDRSDCPRIRFGRRVVYDRQQLEAFARAHLTHRVGDGED